MLTRLTKITKYNNTQLGNNTQLYVFTGEDIQEWECIHAGPQVWHSQVKAENRQTAGPSNFTPRFTLLNV